MHVISEPRENFQVNVMQTKSIFSGAKAYHHACEKDGQWFVSLYKWRKWILLRINQKENIDKEDLM